MRVLRTSGYHNPSMPAMTIVVRDCDITDTLESVRVQSMTPGLFVVHEIFSMEEADIGVATKRAAELMTEEVVQRERDMAMLYHYDASMLLQVKAGGVLMATRPAPMSSGDIGYVFEQLVNHPNYNAQLVMAISDDGLAVQLRDGEVTTMEGPPHDDGS